jgi:TM2 domain-containing membrane protein YozV
MLSLDNNDRIPYQGGEADNNGGQSGMDFVKFEEQDHSIYSRVNVQDQAFSAQQQQNGQNINLAVPIVVPTIVRQDDEEKRSAPLAPAPPPLTTAAVPVAQIVPTTPGDRIDIVDAYVLHIVLGFFGAVHFRMGRPTLGFIYLLTCGGFGFGYLVDLFRLPSLVQDFNDKNGKLDGNESELTLIGDCYALWVLSILGVPQFYLKRNGWGLLYLCTCACFGVGMLVDLFRFPLLVREYQSRKISQAASLKQEEYSLVAAYLLLVPPLGLLGAHHFYLNDRKTGFLYMFTFGLFGLGFIADIFRLPKLVQEANVQNAPYAEASNIV